MAAAVLLDLDGTLYEAGTVVPGAALAVERLRTDGHHVRLLTNTDSRSSSTLVPMLAAMGIEARDGELFTPITAAVAWLGRTERPVVLPLVNDEVKAALGAAVGPERLVAPRQATNVTHVVVGDVRDDLDYHLLDAAYRAVAAGAELVALQKGRYFRAADGAHLDTGAVVAAIEYASATPATVVGKPSPRFLELAVASLPVRPSMSDVWVVGDDRTTDVLMGQQAGALTVAVTTGKYADQIGRSGLPEPDHVLGSVAALPDLIRGAGRDDPGS